MFYKLLKLKIYWKKIVNRSFSIISSFLVSDVSESRISLKSNEQCEWIAQVAYQKWATMSNSLRSLRGNEQSWANCSGRSPKMSEWGNHSLFELIAHLQQAIRSKIQWANSQPWTLCCITHCWVKLFLFLDISDKLDPRIIFFYFYWKTFLWLRFD